MRLGLSQSLRTEQRLVQSPQMIQAMKILQCPMQELQEQIEQELDENVLLEVVEDQDTPEANDNQEATNGSTDSPSGETAVNDSSPELSLDNMEAKLEAQIEKEIDDTERASARRSGHHQ